LLDPRPDKSSEEIRLLHIPDVANARCNNAWYNEILFPDHTRRLLDLLNLLFTVGYEETGYID